jgi:hypothetical protein
MLTSPAWAQDNIVVRAGTGTDYTRLVFEGTAQAPDAKTDNTENQITILFRDDPNVTPSTITAPRIMAYRQVGNGVTIDIPAGQDVRFLTVGKKLIVDIKGPLPKAPPAAPQETKERTPDKTPTKPQPQADEKEVAGKTPAEKLMINQAEVAKRVIAGARTMGSEPSKIVPPKYGKALEPHIISIAATTKMNLAVFERGGRLWIVVDQKKFPITPQIEGNQAAGFPPFERIETDEATAFVMSAPPGYTIRADGAGLLWRVYLADQLPDGEATDLKRQETENEKSLLWPVTDVGNIVTIPDTQMLDEIKVVTVPSHKSYLNQSENFVEFRTLPAVVGLAFVPRIDDLVVKKDNDGVLISAPNGLALSSQQEVAIKPEPLPHIKPTIEEKVDIPQQDGFTRVYQFDRWIMGGEDKREKNIRDLKAAMAGKDGQGLAADAFTLAKLELANGFGAEAAGYLDFAKSLVPELAATPDFKALDGAARALMGQHDKAFENFSDPALMKISELAAWRAYTLAGLEDWTQAGQVLPQDLSFLQDYPVNLRDNLALVLAEVALRAGNPSGAEKTMEMVEDKNLLPFRKAALEYLRGEAERQRGAAEDADKTWRDLTTGADDLYRAKAGLALTALEAEQKKINADQAIDRLEGLRYAWRGDELETAISFRLGKLYIDKGEILKGLTLLRQAASLSPQSQQAKEITAFMTQTYRDLFMTDRLQKLSPVDALSIHDEFSELSPVGEDADKITAKLADRLVDADLLPRAANMLTPLVDKKTGIPAADTALRIATIHMMDGKASDALSVLDKGDAALKDVKPEEAAPKRRAIALLRAQALSSLKKPDDAYKALAFLDQDAEVLRLKADTAWRNQRWQEAADALEQLAAKSDIPLTRPMTEDQANIILNWGVALYLADNRYVLQSLRDKYYDAMLQTPLSKKFDVVTRPRQNALLADRDTIMNIMNEIEIFKGFTEAAKATTPAAAATPAEPKPPAAVPAQDPAAATPITPATSG